MKETDLEMYRWSWYLERIEGIKKQYSGISCNFWPEFGVFVSTLPRQSGKTTMMAKMADVLQKKGEEFFIVVPSLRARWLLYQAHPHLGEFIKSDCSVESTIRGSLYDNFHLFIDDYTVIKQPGLNKYFNCNWKSITMIGTL